MVIRHLLRAFTVIEVTIFLAITGILLIGVMSSISYRVSAQRYNDAVQDVEEFLRRAYSEAINVENSRDDIAFNQAFCSGPVQSSALAANHSASVINANDGTHPGRSTCAIYGQLLTFGENNNTTAHLYTIVGRIRSSDLEDSVSSVFDALKVVGADAYAFDYGVNNTQCKVASAGASTRYTPLWDAEIQRTDSNQLLKGAVIIVRSPVSGAIHTYRLKDGESIELADKFDIAFSCGGSPTSIINTNNTIQAINYHLSRGDFEIGDFDICVNSPDIYAAGNSRRNLRIIADGRNASAVKYVEVDSEDNRC